MWGALGGVVAFGLTLAVASIAVVYFLSNDVTENRGHHTGPGFERRRRKRIKHSDIDQLCRDFANGIARCVICVENMTPEDNLWNCHNCFISYHLRCIEIWAKSNHATWPCPSCRHQYDRSNVSILTYTCFCGRINNPKKLPRATPHSCGAKCFRGGCHRLCHPGQCPNDF